MTIYTITFNPAIDCVVKVPALTQGEIIRASSQNNYFGGKGVNVSVLLTRLGRDNVALGFLAGPIGESFATALDGMGVAHDFVRLPEGSTRINTKIRQDLVQADGSVRTVETAINGAGPDVDEASLAAFFSRLDKVRDGDVVVLSGAAPKNAAPDAYARILAALADRDVMVVVDATGDTLMNALPYRPFLVKPNNDELAEITGCSPEDEEALAEGARMLQARGARNVLVSRGGDGSILLDETGAIHVAPVIPGTLVNSVGAGDSMVAGFVYGYLEALEDGAAAEGPDLEAACRNAFEYAQACGSATAFSEDIAQPALVRELLEGLRR